ncbi:hypothetical protein [Pedobacter hartonius]|uniref:Uncharacterized protein n=1 Tax=Pedobacter hartonius TaxID=425514 RepID=A0A1H4BWV7_9SPHI|nr:hypothetical protein [Pedobacter hartonius]SEA52547.1 hypothetical protein SAMN05443550_103498 [Pedobacter hartonius]
MNQLFLGVLVAGTALGGSALSNVESHTTTRSGKTLPAGYFVQKAANSYSYVSTTTGRDGQCDGNAAHRCKYIVPAQNSIPSEDRTYTESEVQNFGLSPSEPLDRIWIPASE